MAKEKYTIEYNLNTVSLNVLWGYIATPHGLANWFADDVEQEGKKFIFHWDTTQQEAEQVGYRNGVFVRFRWKEDENEPERPYFEFRIAQIELIGTTMLDVTDFTEPEEKEDSIELWNTQIETLMHRLGI
jgi:hypothetical protein